MKILAIIVFIFIPAIFFTQTEFCFQLSPDSIIGRYPNSVAFGDMNNDGNIDMVDPQIYQNLFTRVLLSDGAGNFTSTINIPQLYLPWQLITAKLNQDANLDIVARRAGADTIYFVFGTGNGSVTAINKIKTPSALSAMEVTDINGDNKNDFVVSCPVASVVSVFFGTGTGTFSTAVSYSFSDEPQNIIVRDYNNDGYKDLFVAGTNMNYFLKGSASGNLVAIPGPSGFSTSSPYDFADLNSDNRPDLISRGSDSIRVRLSTGNFNFGNTSRSYVQGLTLNNNIGPFVISDLNNDGKNDIAIGTHGYSLSVLYGNGMSTFSAQQTYFTPILPYGVRNIYAADLTNDQKQDLIVFVADGPMPIGYYAIFINCNLKDVSIETLNEIKGIGEISPNPSTDHIVFNSPEFSDGQMEISIYDQHAKKIRTLEVNFFSGKIELNVTDFPAGLYFLQYVTKDNQVQRLKFIVAR